MAPIAFCDYLRPLAITLGPYCINMDERRMFSRTIAETLHFLAGALDWLLYSWRRIRKMAIESNKANMPESFFICR
jgi:hypothetical protein